MCMTLRRVSITFVHFSQHLYTDLFIAGNFIFTMVDYTLLVVIVHNVAMESLRETSHGKQRTGLGFSCFHADLADPNAEGDKLLAAQSLTERRRRTFKLQEDRGKSSVPRLLMSAIVRAEFPNELISD